MNEDIDNAPIDTDLHVQWSKEGEVMVEYGTARRNEIGQWYKRDFRNLLADKLRCTTPTSYKQE